MAELHPRCPKCDVVMDLGHLPDVTHGAVLTASWAPGAPAPRRFAGGIKYDVHAVIPLDAYRCPACGYVEFYAPPA